MINQRRVGWIRYGIAPMLWLLPTCIGCTDPVWLDEIGDPCRSDYSFCVDAASVQRCEDDVWTVTSCETVCGEMGMSFVAEGCHETCDCVLVDPEGCTPGEAVCSSDSEVSICDDAQQWMSSDCASVCANAGLASVGCKPETESASASCWCTSEGTACDPGDAPLCVDEAVLATCIDEAWVFQTCTEICNGTGVCLPSGASHECECG